MAEEKLCTLMIRDMVSVKNITEGLLLNGYRSEVAPVPKEYPRTGIAYFTLTICCAESFLEIQEREISEDWDI